MLQKPVLGDNKTFFRISDSHTTNSRNIGFFRFSPDGSKVAWTEDTFGDGRNFLYVADKSGANRQTVFTPINSNESVISFEFSPDSLKIGYLYNYILTPPSSNLTKALASYIISSSTNILIYQGSSAAARSLYQYYWNAASTRIIFTEDYDTPTQFNCNLKSGDALSVAIPVTLKANYVVGGFALTPNRARIVYRFINSGTGSNPTLRTMLVDGSGDLELNAAFDLGARPASVIRSFVCSPDSLYVAYATNQDNNSITELYCVKVDATERNKVSGSMTIGGNVSQVQGFDYKFSHDSQKVLYKADQNTNNKDELFITNKNGSTNLNLSGSTIAAADVIRFIVSSNNEYVYYIVDGDTDAVNELYRSKLDGSVIKEKVNDTLSANEQVIDFELSPDNSTCTYIVHNSVSGLSKYVIKSISGALSTLYTSSGITLVRAAVQTVKQEQPAIFYSKDSKKVYLFGNGGAGVGPIYSHTINGNRVRTVKLQGSTLGLISESFQPSVYHIDILGETYNSHTPLIGDMSINNELICAIFTGATDRTELYLIKM